MTIETPATELIDLIKTAESALSTGHFKLAKRRITDIIQLINHFELETDNFNATFYNRSDIL